MSPKRKNNKKALTLDQAVDLGEYNPKYLSKFQEFLKLSPHVQLQYIRKGLDIRRKQLLVQWAELDRAIDSRLKPKIQIAKKNIEKQLKQIEKDREKYYYEYSQKF